MYDGKLIVAINSMANKYFLFAFSVAGGAKDGHTIIYKTSVFDLNDFGVVDLTPHDKYGVRSVEYALFTHKASGKLVDHFNTHFCVCTDQGIELYSKFFYQR